MAFMGLDIGTTGSKAVVFSLDGKILASAYREYPMHSPRAGWLELDPNEVMAAVREVVTKVQADSPEPIEAFGTSGLGEAFVPVDANMQPLDNSIIGFDVRGQKECDEFRQQIDNVDVFKITGHPINSYHSLFKILHLRNHQPEMFAKVHKFLCFPDFLSARLGIEPAIDYSLAARMLLFDVNEKRWSSRLLDLVGLDSSLLARPAAPGQVIGRVGRNDLGFAEGMAMVAGLHDQPAGILGAGVDVGQSMLATGTVVCMGVLLDQQVDPAVMTRSNLCRYPTYGGNSVSLAWNFTGGSALRWFRDNFAQDLADQARRDNADVYDLIFRSLPEKPTNLLFLPYLTTTGTPYLDTQAAGALVGLHLKTTRWDIARAVVEGVVYELRLNQDLLTQAGVRIDEYRGIGGAAKSPVWMQTYADVLDRPVTVLEITEGACWGVALLAAAGLGRIDNAADYARKAVISGRTYKPRAEFRDLYQKRLDLYRQIYPTNKDLIHQLVQLD